MAQRRATCKVLPLHPYRDLARTFFPIGAQLPKRREAAMDAQAGDRDRELCQLLRDVAYPYIWDKLNRRGNRPEDRQRLTEDLVSTVKVKVRERWDELWPGSPLRPYVMKVAKSVLIDYFRRASRFEWISLDAPPRSPEGEQGGTLAERFPDPDRSPEDEIIARADRAVVRRALRKLPDEDREWLIQKYWRGLTDREIAISHAVSESAVTSRLHRLRGVMRGYILADPGWEPSSR
jgi:RNA polymerase sigma factor (sigma-70 family)